MRESRRSIVGEALVAERVHDGGVSLEGREHAERHLADVAIPVRGSRLQRRDDSLGAERNRVAFVQSVGGFDVGGRQLRTRQPDGSGFGVRRAEAAADGDVDEMTAGEFEFAALVLDASRHWRSLRRAQPPGFRSRRSKRPEGIRR